jgi:hypothetical protein
MSSPLRSVQIYAAERGSTIIAPMHFNSAGIRYEQEGMFLAESGSWDAVVPTLRNALEKFSFREANLRDQRLTDWASYRASGLRSVRQFRREYLCIQIIAVNQAELFYDASCQPHGESEITLHVTLNPYAADKEIARQLDRLFRACLRWPIVMSELPPTRQ